MNLESLSLKELKQKAADNGVLNYHNMSKPKLIKTLNVLLPEEEVKTIISASVVPAVEVPIVEEVQESSQNVKLSVQALRWQDYLKNIGSTAEVFLRRYPNHKYKIFIEEILLNEQRQINNTGK
jgi:hypothetical protein